MSLIEVISVVTLKRTDTTLDLSQKAKRFGVFKKKNIKKEKKLNKLETRKMMRNLLIPFSQILSPFILFRKKKILTPKTEKFSLCCHYVRLYILKHL